MMKKNSIICILILYSIFILLSCVGKDIENDVVKDIAEEGISSIEIVKNKDINDILNIILSSPIIYPYFHFEKEEKFYIYENDILMNYVIQLKDNRFFLTNNIVKNKRYIEFKKIQKKGLQDIQVHFEIPYEGIIGILLLEKYNSKWIIKNKKIVEH